MSLEYSNTRTEKRNCQDIELNMRCLLVFISNLFSRLNEPESHSSSIIIEKIDRSQAEVTLKKKEKRFKL